MYVVKQAACLIETWEYYLFAKFWPPAELARSIKNDFLLSQSTWKPIGQKLGPSLIFQPITKQQIKNCFVIGWNIIRNLIALAYWIQIVKSDLWKIQ